MSPEQKKQIILATLEQVNIAYDGGKANSLVSTRGGHVDPDTAYIELVREILALAD